MPHSSRVEELLSDAAHYVQTRVDQDEALHDELALLFANGQAPHVLRVLQGFVNAAVFIKLGKPDIC